MFREELLWYLVPPFVGIQTVVSNASSAAEALPAVLPEKDEIDEDVNDVEDDILLSCAVSSALAFCFIS